MSDDELFSPSQTERLTGTYAGGSTGGVDLTIVDDEAPPVLALSLNHTRITEGDLLIVKANLNRGYANQRFLPIASVTGATAKLSQGDYNAAESEVNMTFFPGETESTDVIEAVENTTPGDYGQVVFTVPTDNPLFTAGPPSSVTLTIVDNDAAPSAPRSLNASPGNAEVTLDWLVPTSYSTTQLTKYELKVTPGVGSFTNFANIPGSDEETISYTVTGLTDDTPYTFEVRAKNDGGVSTAASVMATPREHGVSINPFRITEGGSSRLTIIPEGAPFTTTKVITVVLASTPGLDQPRKDSDFGVSADGPPADRRHAVIQCRRILRATPALLDTDSTR